MITPYPKQRPRRNESRKGLRCERGRVMSLGSGLDLRGDLLDDQLELAREDGLAQREGAPGCQQIRLVVGVAGGGDDRPLVGLAELAYDRRPVQRAPLVSAADEDGHDDDAVGHEVVYFIQVERALDDVLGLECRFVNGNHQVVILHGNDERLAIVGIDLGQ